MKFDELNKKKPERNFSEKEKTKFFGHVYFGQVSKSIGQTESQKQNPK